MAILSVSQLNRYVGFKLKEDRALQGILVRGEITNFTTTTGRGISILRSGMRKAVSRR